MRPVAPPFRGVVVAEVLSVAPHPDADRLRVCAVDAGQGASLSIVCGAPNVRAGMKVPCALVGAELPPAKEGTSEPFRIQLGKIRGVESRGMLCSARELKLSDDHEGLLVLDDRAVIGRDLRAELALDDTIFTLKLTPNLGHALSVFGVARELAAITGAPLQVAGIPAGAGRRRPRFAGHGRVARSVRALFRPRRPERRSARDDAALDGRAPRPLRPAHGLAAGRHLELRDVRARPAIAHLRSGQDRGRPDGALGRRKASRSSCSTAARSSSTRPSASSPIEVRVESLAGIMGGAATAVSDATRNVYVEAAFWWPEAVAGRSRRYHFSTDAGHRFERGVDPATTVAHIERLTALIVADLRRQRDAAAGRSTTTSLPCRSPSRCGCASPAPRRSSACR